MDVLADVLVRHWFTVHSNIVSFFLPSYSPVHDRRASAALFRPSINSKKGQTCREFISHQYNTSFDVCMDIRLLTFSHSYISVDSAMFINVCNYVKFAWNVAIICVYNISCKKKRGSVGCLLSLKMEFYWI